ncbi:nitroreductase family protein [Spirochaeta thermophila]|uniref:Putative nitroreductase n=1 Tax=Winmispira thermophila (strain ATCC 49972 / DSM 6192 / RI 19.B1) TaxID=665571 RepID=E0RP31_WINT6|nr:nitroreductase family protein [Spirochaeta thermophila]ADN02693.1 putative nitroreductase [Spirochaeta thermophila DSM 6192]
MELLPEIAERVSVRSFTDRVPPEDVVRRILEAGRLAPSAKNRQAWRFVVIRKEEVRRKIEEAAFHQEYVGQAPVIIAGCTTNVEYRMPNGQLSYPIDISIAMTQMMLQAVHEGLGTCFVSSYDEERVKYVLSVPYSMRVVLLLLLGYPAEEPLRPERYPLERIVGFDHW